MANRHQIEKDDYADGPVGLREGKDLGNVLDREVDGDGA